MRLIVSGGPPKGHPCPCGGRAESLPRPFWRNFASLGAWLGERRPGNTKRNDKHGVFTGRRHASSNPYFAFVATIFCFGRQFRRGEDSLHPRLLSGSPLSLTRTHALRRFAVPALACKSCARLPALGFPAALGRPGQTLRALPVRRAKGSLDPWQVSGSPMASPFSWAIPALRTFCFVSAPV